MKKMSLQEIKKQHNLTDLQLAQKIGVTRECITQWINRKRRPNYKNVLKISANFPQFDIGSLYE